MPILPDLHFMGRDEGSMAPHVLNVLQAREDIRVLRPAKVGNQAVLRADHRSEIRRPSVLESEALEGMIRYAKKLIPDGKEAFAGNAAHVHACAANRPAINHQCPRPVSVRSDRGAECRAPAPKDRQVVPSRHALAFGRQERSAGMSLAARGHAWMSRGPSAHQLSRCPYGHGKPLDAKNQFPESAIANQAYQEAPDCLLSARLSRQSRLARKVRRRNPDRFKPIPLFEKRANGLIVRAPVRSVMGSIPTSERSNKPGEPKGPPQAFTGVEGIPAGGATSERGQPRPFVPRMPPD